MKNIKLLFILLSSIFLSNCSNNIDERMSEPIDVTQKYFISDDFLKHDNLSENEVRFVAEKFTTANPFNSSSRRTRALTNLEIDNVYPLLSESGQTLAFAVNFIGGGYNIVSATKKYAPIIGFSETGSIDDNFKENNPSFAYWMEYMKADILCQMNKKEDSDTTVIKTVYFGENMRVLLRKTMFHQDPQLKITGIGSIKSVIMQ